jgi:hypothetical protein
VLLELRLVGGYVGVMPSLNINFRCVGVEVVLYMVQMGLLYHVS